MKLGELLDKVSDLMNVCILVLKTDLTLNGSKESMDCMLNKETLSMEVKEVDCDSTGYLRIFVEEE